MKAQELIDNWLNANPFTSEKEREIRELTKAVDDIVATIGKDYDRHRGLVDEALSYFFTEEFNAKEIKAMHNDLRK